MKFADFVCVEAIRADLKATDKKGVIREMTQSLLDAGRIAEDEYESIVKGILKREKLGSTGLWTGIAIPHTKHPSVDRLVGTAAICRQGVDFGSLDGELVHFFFLLISSSRDMEDHVRALSLITQRLHQETFRRFLTQAKSAEEIRQLLDEADNDSTL